MRESFAQLHISIPRILLNKKPAASDRTKNSQIQFHSSPANAMTRAGYCTSIVCTRLLSGNAGSAEYSSRLHHGPRKRTADNLGIPEPTTTCFADVWADVSTLTTKLPSRSATTLQTTSFSAGTWTAGAVLASPAGSSRVASPSASAPVTRALTRNG